MAEGAPGGLAGHRWRLSRGSELADPATAFPSTSPAAQFGGTGDVPTPAVTPTAAITATRSPASAVRVAEAAAQTEFSRAVSEYLEDRSGIVAVMAVDVATGVMVSSDRHRSCYTASIVKVDILATLLLQRQDQQRLPTSAEQALARRMITISDNDAASDLWERIGGSAGLAAANRRFGLRETEPGTGTLWGLTRTTAADQIRLLRVVTRSSGVLGAKQRSYARRLMTSVDDDQAWGVSAAAATGSTVALKNGWLPYSQDGYRWIVNSIGRVRTSGGETLLIAVLSRRAPSLTYGVTTVEHLSRLAAAAVDRHPVA